MGKANLCTTGTLWWYIGRPSFGQVALLPFIDIGNRFFDPEHMNFCHKKRPLGTGSLRGLTVIALLSNGLRSQILCCCIKLGKGDMS